MVKCLFLICFLLIIDYTLYYYIQVILFFFFLIWFEFEIVWVKEKANVCLCRNIAISRKTNCHYILCFGYSFLVVAVNSWDEMG